MLDRNALTWSDIAHRFARVTTPRPQHAAPSHTAGAAVVPGGDHVALAPRPHHPAHRRRMAPLNPRGGRPRTRLVRHIHQRETTCHLCGFEVDMNLDPQLPLGRSVDELIPIADNGDPLDPTNCRLAHRCCNSSRGRRQITEAIRKRCRELVLAHQGHTAPTIRPW